MPDGARSKEATPKIDIDFSLAIHNRTGKYFIGRDLIDTAGLPLGDVYYWRLKVPPRGLVRRIVGRLQLLQITGKTIGGPLSWLPRRHSRRSLLHLDPFTVPTTRLSAQDAVLCHDLGPITHPHLFAADVGKIYESIYREIASIGPHLIFVSQATRRLFEDLFPAARPSSSRVIYPALRTDIVPAMAEPVAGVGDRFLLTVGSIGDRKNQAKSIAAFAKSGLHEAGVQFVLCGGREPGYESVAAIAKETPGVILLPYVSDANLAWLYGAASGFVLLSQLEGFGMPVSEAIARGQVPLVSRDSVLEEVAGEGALTADPDDIDEMARMMFALGQMQGPERAERTRLLTSSIQRFSLLDIQQRWRDAFRDFQAQASKVRPSPTHGQ